MADHSSNNDYLGPTILMLLIGGVMGWIILGPTVRVAVWEMLRIEASFVAYFSGLYGQELRELLPGWRERLSEPVPPDLSLRLVYVALDLGGRYLRWPVALACVAAGLWVVQRSPSWRYRRTMGFEGLLAAQARSFPRIRPILHLKGRLTRETRGNYWWPESPFEWALRHGVIRGSTPQERMDSFDHGAARRGFELQLGKRITGAVSVKELAFHEQVLLAVFAARILNRKKDADHLLDAASEGFGPAWSSTTRLLRRLAGRAYDWPANGPWEMLLNKRAEALLASLLTEVEKHAASGEGRLGALLRAHGYTRPMFAAAMSGAQDGGIITTSDFAWLKAVDRPLHCVLNDVGRRVAIPESSGSRAHALSEANAAGPLDRPHVGDAVAALRTSLEECAWSPPPSMDLGQWREQLGEVVGAS